MHWQNHIDLPEDARTKSQPSPVLTLGQRRRRWSNVNTGLGQGCVESKRSRWKAAHQEAIFQ